MFLSKVIGVKHGLCGQSKPSLHVGMHPVQKCSEQQLQCKNWSDQNSNLRRSLHERRANACPAGAMTLRMNVGTVPSNPSSLH